MNCLSCEFIAESEHLEIIGGVPSSYGEIFGLIRTPNADMLAVFRAIPNATGLDLLNDPPRLRRSSDFTRSAEGQP